MAVVNLMAAGLPNPNAAKPGRADVRQKHGVLRTSTFVASIANGDSATSTYEVARLPSHARISRLSQLHSSGVAGATDVDLGVAGAATCLVNGASLVAAASVNAATGITAGEDAKALWELAGLAKDPKSELSVYLTLNTNATGAGTVAAELVYIVD